MLADRMGCLKAGVVADVVVPTPDYVRFATHFRFRPDFCHAKDPQSKGIVENLVGYAKDDLMVPLGALDGSGSGWVTVPEGVRIADYPTVDVSEEPDDGDPGHSGASVLRGDVPV